MLFDQKIFFVIASLFAIHSICISQQIDSSANHTHSCSHEITPSGVVIGNVTQPRHFMFEYKFMFMDMRGMNRGTNEIHNQEIFNEYLMNANSMQMSMHMFMFMYGLNDNITLMAMANYLDYTMQMSMLPGTEHNHGKLESNTKLPDDVSGVNGLGDTRLLGLFKIFEAGNHAIVGHGGASIPTGSISIIGKANSMNAGNRVPYNMQLGSGSIDFIGGVSLYCNAHRVRLASQLNTVIRSSANKLGYKLGNEISLNTWVSSNVFRWWHISFRTEAALTKRITGKDKTLYVFSEPASNNSNYGGEKVNCFLGYTVLVKNILLKQINLGAEAGIPMYQRMQGIQLRTNFLMNLSISAMF